MRELCAEVANNLREACGEPAHPLELGLRLHDWINLEKRGVPALAQALCVAFFDAAIYDAVGYATGKLTFAFYEESVAITVANAYFSKRACEALESLECWWVANAQDDLDGELADAVKRRDFRRVKVKLLRRNVEGDVHRTVAVYRAMRCHGAETQQLCVDSNEAHMSAGEYWSTWRNSRRPICRFSTLCVLGAADELGHPLEKLTGARWRSESRSCSTRVE